MTEPNGIVNLDRIRELALGWRLGSLTDQQASELSDALASSLAAREEFREIVLVHAQLDWELGDPLGPSRLLGERLAESSVPAADALPQDSSLQPSLAPAALQPPSALWPLAVAASLLFAVASGGWMLWRNGDQELPKSVAKSAVVVGEISPLVTKCNWSFGRPGGNNASDVWQGDTVLLNEGAVEMRLANNTVALLESPAIVQVIAPNRVRVIQGGVKVEVAEGAEGFAVETDTAEVIDLGTVFSVNVDVSGTDLVVYDGEVDLKVTPAGDAGKGRAGGPAKRFRAGEAVQVAHDGTLSRIVNVKQSNVQLDRAEGGEKPAIAAVRDNNIRSDFYSFYEIVPGGMQEDAKAFVDRPHEWNGVRTTGMPAYLVGGDYVKTFNDDKVVDALSIELTMARPATLYVLLDKRVVPPQWLLEAFKNTGDEIGVDEVHLRRDDRSRFDEADLRVGAGKGVNRTHSIWKKDVPQGGVVSLGANGDLAGDAAAGVHSEANMYGLVAVPLGPKS